MNPRLIHSSLLSLGTMVMLGGCDVGPDHSPTVDVLGSYFPAWMVCIILGIAITSIVRLLLIGVRLHSHLRWKLLFYFSMAILFTVAVWLLFYKN